MQGSTLEQLQQQLQSAIPETRRQAVHQLGQLKDERAVEVLVMALTGGERDLSVWYAVARALAAIGDARAVPALVEALQHHEDDFVRAEAAGILGKIGGAQAVEVLASALQEDEGMGGAVRAAAAWALGEIGGAQAVEALIAHLEWGDKFEVLCNVAEALGKIGGTQAIESLGRVLNDDHTESTVRQAAAKALGVI
jgi:HEAT repeat protein